MSVTKKDCLLLKMMLLLNMCLLLNVCIPAGNNPQPLGRSEPSNMSPRKLRRIDVTILQVRTIFTSKDGTKCKVISTAETETGRTAEQNLVRKTSGHTSHEKSSNTLANKKKYFIFSKRAQKLYIFWSGMMSLARFCLQIFPKLNSFPVLVFWNFQNCRFLQSHFFYTSKKNTIYQKDFKNSEHFGIELCP